jgi:hypothetical protein
MDSHHILTRHVNIFEKKKTLSVNKIMPSYPLVRLIFLKKQLPNKRVGWAQQLKKKMKRVVLPRQRTKFLIGTGNGLNNNDTNQVIEFGNEATNRSNLWMLNAQGALVEDNNRVANIINSFYQPENVFLDRINIAVRIDGKLLFESILDSVPPALNPNQTHIQYQLALTANNLVLAFSEDIQQANVEFTLYPRDIPNTPFPPFFAVELVSPEWVYANPSYKDLVETRYINLPTFKQFRDGLIQFIGEVRDEVLLGCVGAIQTNKSRQKMKSKYGPHCETILNHILTREQDALTEELAFKFKIGIEDSLTGLLLDAFWAAYLFTTTMDSPVLELTRPQLIAMRHAKNKGFLDCIGTCFTTQNAAALETIKQITTTGDLALEERLQEELFVIFQEADLSIELCLLMWISSKCIRPDTESFYRMLEDIKDKAFGPISLGLTMQSQLWPFYYDEAQPQGWMAEMNFVYLNHWKVHNEILSSFRLLDRLSKTGYALVNLDGDPKRAERINDNFVSTYSGEMVPSEWPSNLNLLGDPANLRLVVHSRVFMADWESAITGNKQLAQIDILPFTQAVYRTLKYHSGNTISVSLFEASVAFPDWMVKRKDLPLLPKPQKTAKETLSGAWFDQTQNKPFDIYRRIEGVALNEDSVQRMWTHPFSNRHKYLLKQFFESNTMDDVLVAYRYSLRMWFRYYNLLDCVYELAVLIPTAQLETLVEAETVLNAWNGWQCDLVQPINLVQIADPVDWFANYKKNIKDQVFYKCKFIRAFAIANGFTDLEVLHPLNMANDIFQQNVAGMPNDSQQTSVYLITNSNNELANESLSLVRNCLLDSSIPYALTIDGQPHIAFYNEQLSPLLYKCIPGTSAYGVFCEFLVMAFERHCYQFNPIYNGSETPLFRMYQQIRKGMQPLELLDILSSSIRNDRSPHLEKMANLLKDTVETTLLPKATNEQLDIGLVPNVTNITPLLSTSILVLVSLISKYVPVRGTIYLADPLNIKLVKRMSILKSDAVALKTPAYSFTNNRQDGSDVAFAFMDAHFMLPCRLVDFDRKIKIAGFDGGNAIGIYPTMILENTQQPIDTETLLWYHTISLHPTAIPAQLLDYANFEYPLRLPENVNLTQRNTAKRIHGFSFAAPPIAPEPVESDEIVQAFGGMRLEPSPETYESLVLLVMLITGTAGLPAEWAQMKRESGAKAFYTNHAYFLQVLQESSRSFKRVVPIESDELASATKFLSDFLVAITELEKVAEDKLVHSAILAAQQKIKQTLNGFKDQLRITGNLVVDNDMAQQLGIVSAARDYLMDRFLDDDKPHLTNQEEVVDSINNVATMSDKLYEWMVAGMAALDVDVFLKKKMQTLIESELSILSAPPLIRCHTQTTQLFSGEELNPMEMLAPSCGYNHAEMVKFLQEEITAKTQCT